MANNTKTVNFGFGSQPDLQLEQIKLQRQQALIDALRKDSLTPLESQTVSGAGPAQVVKTSPLLGLANLGKAYFAGKMQDEADQKSVALGEESKKRMTDALRGLAPAGTFDDNPSFNAKAGQLGSGTMDALPAPSEGVMPTVQNQSNVDPTIKQAWVTALKAMQLDPDLGKKLVENASTLTNEQKNMSVMGQDPRLMGALAVAEARKKGMLEMQPGNTVLDLSNNNRMVAPDFKTGIAGGYSPNGMPIMSKIAGSEIIPQMAGEVAAQEAIGKAGGELIPITTPEGETSLNVKRDALLQASGQNTPQSNNNNGVSFKGDDRLNIIRQELAKEKLLPDSDPNKAKNIAALQREESRLSGGAPNRGGIPIQSDVQKEAQIGAIKVKNAVDEQNLKNYPDYVLKKQTTLSDADLAIKSIEKLLSHPGLPQATGLQGAIDPRNYIPGTNAKDAEILIKQVKGQTFLDAYNKLRGAGAITEQEGKAATDAKARLDRAQSTPEYIIALGDLKEILDSGVKRLKSTPDPVDLSRNRLSDNPTIPTSQNNSVDYQKLYGIKLK